MTAEAAAGSMMDEEWRAGAGAGAGDVHIAALRERVNPLSASPQACKETQLQASTTNEIPHTATILAH